MHRLGAALALLLYAGNLCSAASSGDETFIGNRRNWWAFQKPVRPAVPSVTSAWIRTPIDAFLLQAMQAKGLSPSPPLDRVRLIRRVTLDLTGLPPTPDEVDAFIKDKSPKAYEKLVDRLLASPHYGERWAQRWLDVVRYADTNGYELDADRPHAWRYRDYVVDSFNRDRRYDVFLKQQVAGDELWPGDNEALIATGFHRAGPIHLVGGNQDEEMNRQEVLSEMAGGIGSVFLGLTVGCAKCHNHKFDPILQADYYRLQALFAATEGKDVVIATREERDRFDRDQKQYEERLKPIAERIKTLEQPYRDRIKNDKTAKLDAKLRAALDAPKDKRTPEQEMLAKDAGAQIGVTWDEVVAALTPETRAQRAALRKQLHEIELTAPEPLPTAYAVQDMGHAPVTHILKIGDPHNQLGPVDPGLPTVLAVDNGNIPADPCSRRAALANWLASPENPLTARVMVNRIWQFRMGTGLVRTPNDFGRLGERPSNPQLLDWLATEFVDGGWSVKNIDRQIVLSSAYTQLTSDNEAKSKIDPDNKLYWRMNRRRLEGEAIRDEVLSASGKLNLKVGGRPVRVPIEKEVYDLIFSEDEPDNLWPLSADETQQYRRSVYLLNKRTVRLPMLLNFDQPDAMTSCPVRSTSTHALQALSLMNSEFMHRQSEAFAARLASDCAANQLCQIRRAYRLTLARAPLPKEIVMARGFLKSEGHLADFCLALLNRNEFVYVP
jgi:hypothetical protein